MSNLKKNVLFIINNLNCGGAEKALISLLEEMDYSRFDVDLFLFKHEGMFMKSIPKEINLLPESENYRYFDMSLVIAAKELLKKLNTRILFNRVLFKFLLKTDNPSIYEQKGWKYVSSAFDKLEKEYDVAIGYLEKNPIYFCVDKVKAKKKIGWIHTEYSKLGIDKSIDNYYFSKIDNIFTVSNECKIDLEYMFPQYDRKIEYMPNIISEKRIKFLSKEEVTDIRFDVGAINIVSVGRLEYVKGFDLAIEVSKILIKNGNKIKWYIIGEGSQRVFLENKIDEYDLENSFELLGEKENPYPYISKADIYVQPSRFEGMGISISEAKCLKKPIVITNFKAAKSQIKNDFDGLIVDIDAESIANGITLLINNQHIKNKFIKNLMDEHVENSLEINKLYEIM